MMGGRQARARARGPSSVQTIDDIWRSGDMARRLTDNHESQLNTLFSLFTAS
jgi:hypothetical protein